MPTSVGPNTFGEENLVFGYDLLDVSNSYKGEPTTNIAANLGLVDLGAGLTYLGIEDGWRKYSMSGTWSNGGYPYSMALAAVTFTGGLAYTATALVKTNVEHKFNYFGTTGISYVNAPKDFEGTQTSTLNADGSHTVTRINFAYTSTTGQMGYLYTNPINGTTFDPNTDFVWVKEFQVEQKDHATQFVNGTRSATQGLLDLTGRNSIDLSNASFNSDAQIEFDGTDSYIQTNFGDNITSGFTVEFIFYATTNQTHFPMQMFVSADANTVFRVERFSAGADTIEFGHSENGGSIGGHELTSFNFPNNTWHHCTLVYDGTYKYIYKNGVVDTSTNDPTITWYSGATLRIGARQNDTLLPIAGYMPMVKVYNRALTATEIKTNFNAIKGRYGL